MLKRSFHALLILAILALSRPAAAADEGPFILVNAETGTVLAEHRSGEAWYPASLTKLMTAYLVFRAMDAGRLAAKSAVVISENALAEPPAKMGFSVGTVMTVDNALKMMIVKSANDIAVALAETVSGSEASFVTAMNAEAARLGMSGTHFINPNGLPGDGQRTTARDFAILARAIWREFPQHRPLFGITAIKAGKRVLRSPNMLLERYRGANGMKTGFICASGYNVVASATRGSQTMIAVVLGETSSLNRAETAAGLLNRGFATWPLLAGGRQTLETFVPARVTAEPVSMRDLVCGAGRGRGGEAADGDISAVSAGVSALGPRIAIMDPVRVFTGGAEAPGARVSVPLPRPRPQRTSALDLPPPAEVLGLAVPRARPVRS